MKNFYIQIYDMFQRIIKMCVVYAVNDRPRTIKKSLAISQKIFLKHKNR